MTCSSALDSSNPVMMAVYTVGPDMHDAESTLLTLDLSMCLLSWDFAILELVFQKMHMRP